MNVADGQMAAMPILRLFSALCSLYSSKSDVHEGSLGVKTHIQMLP